MNSMSKNENKLPITKYIQEKMARAKLSKCESCQLCTGKSICGESCNFARYGIIEAAGKVVKTNLGWRVEECPKYVPTFDYYLDDSELRMIINEKSNGKNKNYLDHHPDIRKKIWRVYRNNLKAMHIEDWDKSNELLTKVVEGLVKRDKEKQRRLKREQNRLKK